MIFPLRSLRGGEHHKDVRAGAVRAQPAPRRRRRRRRMRAGEEPRLLRVYSLLPDPRVQRRHAAKKCTTGALSS